MDQNQKLFADEKVLQLRIVDSGYDVLNSDDFKDKDIQRCIHMPNKKTNSKIGITKEEFEEEMKKGYGVENVEWILKDEEGYFKLNGVLMRYEFEGNGNGRTSPPHFGFYSVKNKEANLISETGYRSHFTNVGDVEEYESIIDYVKAFSESFTKDKKGKVIAEFKFEEVNDVEIVIDEEFVARDDLRKWIFKEDKEGERYRERIMEVIEKIGLEVWFKSKGFPTELDSVWKNRYCGTLSTLGEECTAYTQDDNGKPNFQERAYYLWENNLPEKMWNDDDLMNDYKEGTKEYIAKQLEEEENKKKWEKKDRAKAKKEGSKVSDTNDENPFDTKQINLLNGDKVNTKESIEKEEKAEEIADEKKEEEKKQNFLKEFNKAGLGDKGFKELDTKYAFYSETTGLTEVSKDRVLAVNRCMFMCDLFPYTIWICDEFGLHQNTLGITKEFGLELIDILKLEKDEEEDNWVNPKISKDEKGKELAFIDKEIAVKKIEMTNLLKKKVNILKEIKKK